MKIGLYSPYLRTLGGGEKYLFNIAECLSNQNSITVFWNDASILDRAKKQFHLELSRVDVQPDVFLPHVALWRKMMKTRQFDAFFYMSDGSIPVLFSKNNILLFQFPVGWVESGNIVNQMKLKNMKSVVCNSQFVKHFIDMKFNIDSKVISPSVDIPLIEKKKENLILTVGRFTQAMNHKKQDRMIRLFQTLYNQKKLKNWKFVLIGSYLADDRDFVGMLQKMVKGYPIEIITNASRDTVIDYFAKAKIYWHATGFEEDLIRHPERSEHFGISTVEAMIEGAVPVVFNGGGQPEIVENGKNGYLWETPEELEQHTLDLIHNVSLRNRLSEEARHIQTKFSKQRFCESVNRLIMP